MSVETQIQSLTNAVAGLNAAVANVKTSTDKVAEAVPAEASITNKLVDRAYLAANVKAGAQFKIVQQLPTSNIDEATVYVVPVQVGQTDNIYQEWIYINNAWEKIGEPISIQGAKASVRWDDFVGHYQGGRPSGDEIPLYDTGYAAEFFGAQFDTNTAYLSCGSEYAFRGVVVYNDTVNPVTLRYHYPGGSAPRDTTIDSYSRVALDGIMFYGSDDTLVMSGEFVSA